MITDKLLAELEDAIKNPEKHGELPGLVTIGAIRLEEMLSDIKGLVIDAERYRFIRDPRTDPGFLASVPAASKWLHEYMVCDKRMDDAIDQARATAVMVQK